MSECDFCSQYAKLELQNNDFCSMDGRITVVEVFSLGTGISWIPAGEIDTTFLSLNYCPVCGRKLNGEEIQKG